MRVAIPAKTFFDLLIYKTGANLRTEVSRYYLNYLWWVIEPVLTMAVFYVVFGIFMNRGTEHFVAFLLCGLTFWNWFVRSMSNASTSIMGGQGLMQQVDIQKVFFPLEVVLRDCFKLLFSLTLLLVFLLFHPTPLSLTWLALPLLMLAQLCLVAGGAILCAALVPFVPDLKFIISTTLHLMFFGTGIFYNIDSVVLPEHRYLIYLNPMAGLIKAYRQVLIYDTWPDWLYLAKVFVFALLLLAFSLWLVFKLDHVYPRVCQQ
jgi:lipopolysaccharide transport system permease protein